MRLRPAIAGLLASALLLPTAAHAANPLQLLASKAVDARLTELTFRTPAVTGDTGVRILVPAGFDASGRTRYPVLYLLHGAADDFRSWTTKGDAEAITAGAKLIVVMPDSGPGEGYVDWYNSGAFGPPQWETYHLTQLLPWVDAHYPTIAKRSGRAIAGLSMGGYGTMEYAARHPDLFVSASAFSPAVDISSPELQVVNQASELGSSPQGAYGLFLTEAARMHGHNPTDLAANLRGLSLTIRTGNGLPGGPSGNTYDPVEAEVHTEAINLHRNLIADGIPSVFQDYGPGGHQWYYWQRDLRLTLPTIMETLAHPPAPPSPFNYKTIDPDYSVYGWHVVMHRPALEFSELTGVTSRTMTLHGSGSADVTTGAYYRAGGVVRATVRTATGTTKLRLKAGRDRRVHLTVPLGPGNTAQQYTLGATTRVYTTHVNLRPAAKRARRKAHT